MKIGIISDTHLGANRFSNDAYINMKAAMEFLAKKADIIIHAGDVFDKRVPNFEVIAQAIQIFSIPKKMGKKVIVIRGNHERGTKGSKGPVELLAYAGIIDYEHGKVINLNNGGKEISILLFGNVPDDEARILLKQLYLTKKDQLRGFKILVLHQTISDFVPFSKQSYIDLKFLNEMGFDLIINGHIHKRAIKKGFIMPGSTVAVKLNDEELNQDRACLIYDTETQNVEEYIIPTQRKGLYKKLEFNNAKPKEIIKKVMDLYTKFKAEHKNVIVKIKLIGTLMKEYLPSDVIIPKFEDLFIDNDLNRQDILLDKEGLEELKEKRFSIKELAEEKLYKELKDKISIDPIKLFNDLLEKDDTEVLKELLEDE